MVSNTHSSAQAEFKGKIARSFEKSVEDWPEQPVFTGKEPMFWAPGSMHAPHHAPREYIDKYKSKFDMGWDRAREIIFENQKPIGTIPKNTALTARVDEIEVGKMVRVRYGLCLILSVFLPVYGYRCCYRNGRLLDATRLAEVAR